MLEKKQSGVEWIGKIPSNWDVKKLSRVSSKITDFVAAGSFADIKKNVVYRDKPDYAKLIRTADLSKARKIESVYVDESSYNYLSKSNLFGDEIILPNIGSVGDAYYFQPEYPHNTLAPNAILVSETECNKYYFYVFYNMGMYQELRKIGSATTQIKFNKTQLRALKVPVPPIEEQIKIAEYLDKEVAVIDSLILDTRLSIEDLKSYKNSIITETITHGMDKAVPMKDSEVGWIGSVPKSWKVSKIKRLFSITKTIANSNDYQVLSITQRGLKIKDLESNEGQMASDYSKYQIVKPGYFAMNHMDLLTGGVDYSKYEGVTSPDYRVFKITKPEYVNPYYYLYVFKILYWNKIFYGEGQGVSNLGRWRLQADKFNNFYVPTPPITEQNKIVDYLDNKVISIDKLIIEKEKMISDYEEYKKSLVYEYVTGKKRVQ